MIPLHTWTTPNGRKVSIALEELGLPYEVHNVNLGANEQLAPGFLALNPNHKLPVLEDDGLVIWPSYELVPGDIVFLETGNFIPADIRLLEALNLRVEEAWLTGESLPVQKNAATVLDKNVPLGDRKNTAFTLGTLVSYGRGRGVVTSTGMHTQLGLIASMLQNVETEETPLQRRLDQLGKSLSVAALFLVAIVFIVALINYTNINELFTGPLAYVSGYAEQITEVFIIAISLAIAAVPEGCRFIRLWVTPRIL